MKWKTNEFRKKSNNNAAVNSKHAILAVCLFTRCIHLFVQCAFSPSQMTAAIKMKIAIEWKMGAHGGKKCAAPPSGLPAATTAALNAAYLYICVCVCAFPRIMPVSAVGVLFFAGAHTYLLRRQSSSLGDMLIDLSTLLLTARCWYFTQYAHCLRFRFLHIIYFISSVLRALHYLFFLWFFLIFFSFCLSWN